MSCHHFVACISFPIFLLTLFFGFVVSGILLSSPSLRRSPFRILVRFHFLNHLPAHGAKGRRFLTGPTGFFTSSSSTDSLTLLCRALPPCPSPRTACSSSFCMLAASLRFRRASLTLLPTILIRERASPWWS